MTIRRPCKQADEARLAGNFDAAIPLYERALQANPNGVEAKLGLGQSYLDARPGRRGRRACSATCSTEAQRRPGGAARAGHGHDLDGPGAARRTAARGGRAGRSARLPHAQRLGVVLDMQGRHAEAQARYRQGIELAPDFVALRTNFGLSLAISGQPQEAITQLVPLVGSRGADGAGAPEPRLRLCHERRSRERACRISRAGSRRGERAAPARILHAAAGAAGRAAQRRAPAQSKLLSAIRRERLT